MTIKLRSTWVFINSYKTKVQNGAGKRKSSGVNSIKSRVKFRKIGLNCFGGNLEFGLAVLLIIGFKTNCYKQFSGQRVRQYVKSDVQDPSFNEAFLLQRMPKII
ncbi:hypothetical protein [Adhaeribacter aerolatus]|uniref:hypothetical protein n=1 Tax=Adhaeribacter aerolatus TaxID=670289 RepID=UPI0011BD9859|nr:hypothetical protein [Adhaeribacter aerolatus]